MNEWERGNDRRFMPEHMQGYPPGYPADAQMNLPKKKKWLAGLLAFFIPGTGHLYLGNMAKGISIMFLIAIDICAIVFATMNIQEPLVIVLLSLLIPIIYFYNLFDAVQSADIVNQRLRYPAWQPPMYAPRPEYPAPQPPVAPAAAHPGYEAPTGQPESHSYASSEAGTAAGDGSQGPAGPDPMAYDRMPPPAQGPRGLPRQLNATGVMVVAAIVIVIALLGGMGWSGWVFQSAGSMAGAVLLIGAGAGLWLWEMRGDRARKR